MSTQTPAARLVRVASLAELQIAGRLVVHVEGNVVCLFAEGDDVYAVDNRCPHMGFPLRRGSISDGILTCHWHHARFDLCTGGTLDQFADDVRCFPVQLEGDDVYLDPAPAGDRVEHQRRRLLDGLERNIPLVLAKATIVLVEADPSGADVFRAGLRFGVRRRGGGWGRGLTTLTCFTRLTRWLDPADRPLALYHGLADVAADSQDQAPHVALTALPSTDLDPQRLARLFRICIEVRDDEGAERALTSAARSQHATPAQLADMLYAAATDHRYLDDGHALDFVTNALQALDVAGWDHAEAVLASLPKPLASAERQEESNAWRHPIDLVALLEDAFERLPETLVSEPGSWDGRAGLTEIVLGDDPAATLGALLDALRVGATPVEVASVVSFAAATRIARFPTSNEFSDWDTALHTFTFANAVEQGLRRSVSRELVRGVFDAAMSVYLDRFLNIPAKRLPRPKPGVDPPVLLERLADVLDRQQQVDDAGELVASYLGAGGDADALVAALGACLLRENRDFHTMQCIEAAARQHELLRGTDDAALPLIAAARYLAAHSPTTRSQRQTFEIAWRLHRGDELHEDLHEPLA